MRSDRRKEVPESRGVLKMELYLVLRPGSGKAGFAIGGFQIKLTLEGQMGKISGYIHHNGSKNRHCSPGESNAQGSVLRLS